MYMAIFDVLKISKYRWSAYLIVRLLLSPVYMYILVLFESPTLFHPVSTVSVLLLPFLSTIQSEYVFSFRWVSKQARTHRHVEDRQ